MSLKVLFLNRQTSGGEGHLPNASFICIRPLGKERLVSFHGLESASQCIEVEILVRGGEFLGKAIVAIIGKPARLISCEMLLL